MDRAAEKDAKVQVLMDLLLERRTALGLDSPDPIELEAEQMRDPVTLYNLCKAFDLNLVGIEDPSACGQVQPPPVSGRPTRPTYDSVEVSENPGGMQLAEDIVEQYQVAVAYQDVAEANMLNLCKGLIKTGQALHKEIKEQHRELRYLKEKTQQLENAKVLSQLLAGTFV